ncbi:glycosyltransferase [Pseudomonas aeruginosa]|nr:glycosyltransferase [Pseudomonas aeruginosa]
MPLSRSGKNPFSELYLLTYVWRLLWRLRPDVLHLVTIKPVIYGGIAARLAPVKGSWRPFPDLVSFSWPRV